MAFPENPQDEQLHLAESGLRYKYDAENNAWNLYVTTTYIENFDPSPSDGKDGDVWIRFVGTNITKIFAKKYNEWKQRVF